MNTIPSVTINLDKNCRHCGKPGACKNGLCMDCALKEYERRFSMIGDQILSRVKSEIGGLLNIHQHSINQSYLDTENALTVNFSVKFEPTKESNIIRTTVGISFVESKVNEKTSFEIDEKQRPLFDESGKNSIQSSTEADIQSSTEDQSNPAEG